MALQFAPFGVYADVLGVVDAAAKGQITTLLDNFEGLYTQPVGGGSSASPDFDRIPKDVQEKLKGEIDAIRVAIAAAPIV